MCKDDFSIIICGDLKLFLLAAGSYAYSTINGGHRSSSHLYHSKGRLASTSPFFPRVTCILFDLQTVFNYQTIPVHVHVAERAE